MIYLANAFSLSMLPALPASENPLHLVILPATADYVAARLEDTEWQSAVGHAQTAELFTTELGVEVPVNRISVALTSTDRLFVGQYMGPRLPEGTTSLPEGAEIRWFKIGLRPVGVMQNPLHVLS